jgi:nicotinamidase-related amidase
MPELSHIDPGRAALLVMDYQVDALTRFMTTAQSADAIACVPDLIGMARGAGMMVIHVVVAFRPGHPEVSPRNPLFSWAKANGMLVAGSEGAAIHPAASAREGEPIVKGNRLWSSTASARLLAPTWRRCCAPTASTHWCSPVSIPAASCCRPFVRLAIWIIG